MTHTCHVGDCGRSCPTCGERITCMGLDPVAVACSAHDDECRDCNGANPCRDCATIRRMTVVAAAAWEAADEPGPYVGPVRQSVIDSRAESRKEQDDYEYAELVMREEDARW